MRFHTTSILLRHTFNHHQRKCIPLMNDPPAQVEFLKATSCLFHEAIQIPRDESKKEAQRWRWKRRRREGKRIMRNGRDVTMASSCGQWKVQFTFPFPVFALSRSQHLHDWLHLLRFDRHSRLLLIKQTSDLSLVFFKGFCQFQVTHASSSTPSTSTTSETSQMSLLGKAKTAAMSRISGVRKLRSTYGGQIPEFGVEGQRELAVHMQRVGIGFHFFSLSGYYTMYFAKHKTFMRKINAYSDSSLHLPINPRIFFFFAWNGRNFGGILKLLWCWIWRFWVLSNDNVINCWEINFW